jgi:hypothetical protein
VNYLERHFDYVLGPDQDSQLASVAAGKTITCVLELDSDAPFILRSRALRVKYSTDGNDQAGLNHVLARWYGADRQYTSQNLVRQSLCGPYFGQIGNPLPVHPQKFYPPQAEIRVDVKNDGVTALTNLTFYFRGVKLFKPGAVKAYGYPAKCSPFPFAYTPTSVPGNGGMPIITLPVTTGTQGVRKVFLCKTDADFVLQAIQGGFASHADANGNPVMEVFVTLKDEDEKPYSNAPVHIDILAGNSAFGNVYPSGTSTHLPPVAGGPNSPGLVYPEIYIPKNHVFYFDVARADASYGGAAQVDFPLQFIGNKVFLK